MKVRVEDRPAEPEPAPEREADDDLPEGWAWSQLGELCEPPQYGWTTSGIAGGHGVRLLRTTDIAGGAVIWDTVPSCAVEPPDLDKYQLTDGDIVVCRTGAGVGLSHRLSGQCPPAVFASYLIRFRPLDAESGNYISWFLKSPDYWKAVARETVGIAVPNVNASRLRSVLVPVPPAAEQRRIAEAVEALLARVEAGRARLDRVPAILKRFRQAVLAAACSGRLTEDWRAQHISVESADRSIERARGQTRRRYEAACEAAQAARQRKPPKPKVLAPDPIDAADLPELPNGWIWTTFDHVAEDITVGHVGPMAGEYVEAGIPFLRSLNVREFRFEPNELKFISAEFHARLAKSALRPGDVAIVRTGNPGVACVIPPELTKANCADLVILRPSAALNPHYASVFLNSREARARVEDVKVGIAQGHFNIGSMRTTPVPMPPVEEQREIVRRVEALFALADAVERRVAAARKQADGLPRAILARAFSGKLVPTEAELARREGRDYEPASVLLERIRRERAEQPVVRRGRRRAPCNGMDEAKGPTR